MTFAHPENGALLAAMSPGSIVTCRNREWVLLPSDQEDLPLLRPMICTADDMQAPVDALRASESPIAATIPTTPYRWDEARRALLRAELDAWYARAYGLTRDELRYILDPADVHGPDFPGETFRVLKDKETAKFGEYRTRRLVLEAWDKLPPRKP